MLEGVLYAAAASAASPPVMDMMLGLKGVTVYAVASSSLNCLRS
jgi:hypothetical protein